MKISSAIKLILNKCGNNEICFFTNGFISRLGFSVQDRIQNFYMIGSMGLVSSVGLGAALSSPKKVFIFDGDGSLLMNMGAMGVIGYEKPPNLIHLVFDNKTYASTGNQPTISGKIDLSKIAQACGYRKVFNFKNISQLRRKVDNIFTHKGPTFVRLDIDPDRYMHCKRVNIAPDELTKRIRCALEGCRQS